MLMHDAAVAVAAAAPAAALAADASDAITEILLSVKLFPPTTQHRKA